MFEVYNTVLFTTGSAWHSRSLELTHLAHLKLYTCYRANPHVPPPQPLASTVLRSAPSRLTRLDVSSTWSRGVVVLLRLAYIT